jgi:hypothetical protein
MLQHTKDPTKPTAKETKQDQDPAPPMPEYLSVLRPLILLLNLCLLLGTISSGDSYIEGAYVKSFVMLNVFLISSGDLPLIMFATVLHPVSRRGLISR